MLKFNSLNFIKANYQQRINNNITGNIQQSNTYNPLVEYALFIVIILFYIEDCLNYSFTKTLKTHIS